MDASSVHCSGNYCSRQDSGNHETGNNRNRDISPVIQHGRGERYSNISVTRPLPVDSSERRAPILTRCGVTKHVISLYLPGLKSGVSREVLNECLDDLDVVNQTNYRVSLRLKRTGEIFKFVTTPETFPHHYGNMVSNITKHGTKETYGGKYGLYGVSYATRYRLRNALKNINQHKD